jgi:anti-sigma regulatory factor (Ser/Thr protein kinase)
MSDRIELAPSPDSVAQARHWSVLRSRRAGLEAMSDTVALLVSEMVTNVVLHARTTCELTMETSEHRVRVEVRDGSSTLPGRPIVADPMASSGRGMHLIEALADCCGADALPEGGKVVWFQLTEPSGARADA